jgi:hypothetical protein
MILPTLERRNLYKALAVIEEVVMYNIDIWAQRLPDYKILVDSTEDEVKIILDKVPRSMTTLQALYLAERLIATVLEADKIKKLKKWLKEYEYGKA